MWQPPKIINNTLENRGAKDSAREFIVAPNLDWSQKFGGYGNFEIKKNLRDKNGALLIGEAGGFQDYFWGFGMRYAIQTSYLAARSIMNNESYEELIKANITLKMKHSLRNRVLFESLGKLSYPILYYSLAKSRHPLKILKALY
jgi:flavin-dependent dehydrogenase